MKIEIKGLTKRFDDVVAVNNLFVDFEPGVYGLVGHNGAGKSTLLRMIAGILLPNEGEILIDGHSPEESVSKSNVFLLPDEPYGSNNDTIATLVDFYGTFYGMNKERLDSFLREINLPSDRKINTFSKGMKRQAFIAIALAMETPVLLLDEAFDGIDPMVVEIIKKHLVMLSEEGRVIILSSHNIVSLERLVDTFIILSNGSLAESGDADTMSMSFRKFQASGTLMTENNLILLGLELVHFRQVGSVVQFVIIAKEGDEELIQSKLNPLFLEKVGLEQGEIITLEMEIAKKREGMKND